MPDWLGELREGEGAATKPSLGFAEEVVATEDRRPRLAWRLGGRQFERRRAMPDWLGEVEAEAAESVAEVELPIAEEYPDWLSALQPAAAPETVEEAALPVR